MQQGVVVDETTCFEISSMQIDASGPLWGAFNNMETEVSALWIVRLCRERGGWYAFTAEEIEEFYSRSGEFKNFRFNRLVEPGTAYSIVRGNYKTGGGWVVLGSDGKYRVTDDFIMRCYRSSSAASATA